MGTLFRRGTPFLKNFQGAERRYIKDEYLARKDVLEYILWRVLNMDYYELSEPEACQALLLEYKEANDPVRQFWSEMEEQFVWDLLPYDFIHALYLKWMDECSPDSAPLGRNTFKSQLQDVVRTASDIWWVPPKEAEANGVVRQIKRGCFRQIKTVRQEASGKHPVTLLSVYLAHWKKQQTTHAY